MSGPAEGNTRNTEAREGDIRRGKHLWEYCHTRDLYNFYMIRALNELMEGYNSGKFTAEDLGTTDAAIWAKYIGENTRISHDLATLVRDGIKNCTLGGGLLVGLAKVMSYAGLQVSDMKFSEYELGAIRITAEESHKIVSDRSKVGKAVRDVARMLGRDMHDESCAKCNGNFAMIFSTPDEQS